VETRPREDSDLIGFLDQVRAVRARVGAPLVAAILAPWASVLAKEAMCLRQDLRRC
jgi:hypothetical protein